MYKHFISLSVFILANLYLQGQTKNLEQFHAIKTATGIQVELKKGDTPMAEYTIIKGRAEDLHIEVVNGELTVKYKSKVGKWNRTDTKAKVVVYYTHLSSISSSSGSHLSSDDYIVSDEMEVSASSGSKCNIKLQSSGVKVNCSSGSNITIEGSSNTASFNASSGSKINASYLTVAIADAGVSSGANISINASKKLKADASSGGSIKYKGKPESINIDSGMSGSITSF